MVTGSYPVPTGGDFGPAGAPAARPLTARQERFCAAYVLNPNAAEAAREAGYSEASARKQGWRLLRAGRIRARLIEIHADLASGINESLDPFLGKLEVIYRQAVEDRRTLAAVRAVEAQARLARLKTRIPPAAEHAAAALRRELERRRLAGKALAEWRRSHAASRPPGDRGDDLRPLDGDEGGDF